MPRAKGQPVMPKKVSFCLECIAAGFHRVGCPVAKQQLSKRAPRLTSTAPAPAPEEDDAEE